MTNNIQAARKALLVYMEWWSENTHCAGWLEELADVMAIKGFNDETNTFKWLVEEAGGWFIYDKKFIPGTFQELLENGSGEK
jgi:hypothetical protein